MSVCSIMDCRAYAVMLRSTPGRSLSIGIGASFFGCSCLPVQSFVEVFTAVR